MKMSQLLIPTLREAPAEAEIMSHNLMLRAGLMRKLAAGVYSFLPLGYRVIKKIENIVREEMDKKGAQELLLPALQPAELWQDSGRWNVYGKELMRLKDRHDREFCLGPTHEEVITDLVRREVKSYKQLPLNLYQIQTKFRDEIRPRFGLMRGREFIMKDAYSFDYSREGLDESYEKMYEAYCNIFKRCGLAYRAVEADTGTIGGSDSHEFMVMAETGENEIVHCESCHYAANIEKAVCVAPQELDTTSQELLPLEEVKTPDIHTIEELSKFLNINVEQTIKTLLYQADDEVIAVLVRGDREVNEIKLKNILGCVELYLAETETVEKITNAAVGFAGPVHLAGVKIFADYEIKNVINGIVGANKTDYHLKNVNFKRDFEVEAFYDLRLATIDDVCPHCGSPIAITRGIEVGHIFKLGTKYSEAMNATYLDENGKKQVCIMGCYGIGIGRTAAAAIEQNNDDKGIIWPMPIAPFHVVIVPIKVNDRDIMNIADNLYQSFSEKGIEVIIDDRKERPGVKFNDADLIGFPIRIVVGKKSVTENKVEVKLRKNGQEWEEQLDQVIPKIVSIVQEDLEIK